jgi:hypothetical protein
MAIDAHAGDNHTHGDAEPVSAEQNFFKFKAMADAAGISPTHEYWGDSGEEEGIGWTKTSFDFRVMSVKWYPSFPEVQKMEAFFDLAKEMSEDGTANLSGTFVRIGEDQGDIDTRDFGQSPPEIYVVSSIAADRDFSVLGKPYVSPQQTEEV